jgi:hypothetical protein
LEKMAIVRAYDNTVLLLQHDGFMSCRTLDIEQRIPYIDSDPKIGNARAANIIP